MIALLVQAPALYAVSSLLWRIFRQFFTKSDLDNIPGPPSVSLLKGALPNILNTNAWGFHKEIAEKYGGIVKIKGMFGDNQLYVFDPKALHHILVKNQYIYEESTGFIELNRLIFGYGLLGTLGEQHKKQRKMLNPVFSVNHMREMIPTFYDIGHKLEIAISKQVDDGQQEIDVLSWLARTALELVGQSGLGYSFDPLTDDEQPHPYAVAVKGLVQAILKTIIARIYFLGTAVKIGTPRFRRFVLDLIPWPALHELRDIADLMYNTSVEIYEGKKKALAEGDEAVEQQLARGKDIISILMKANMQASKDDQLSEEELIGQMSTLIFAAMDTTSHAMARTLWVLCQHQDVQDKLRAELREAMDGKESLEHDELVALPYMDAVIREVLRLYPPIGLLQRTTRQDIVLPFGTPLKGIDGKDIHEVLIPENTSLFVSILGCNRNPEIWGPDAYEFKPERWLRPLPSSVTDAHIPGVYSNLMTFIGGGRACIGFKFSQLEMKVILSLIMPKFKYTLPKDKEIFWMSTAVASPVVVGTTDRKLPLLVELVK